MGVGCPGVVVRVLEPTREPEDLELKYPDGVSVEDSKTFSDQFDILLLAHSSSFLASSSFTLM